MSLSILGGGAFGKKERLFLGVIAQGIMWGIWKERNKRIFEGVEKGVWEVRDAIIWEVGLWLLLFVEFEVIFLNDFIRDW